MAATLTPAEYEFARGLKILEIPNKLRCAICNRPVFDAMKTDCCDTSICKSCSDKLSKACPTCGHEITSEITREDKRVRITLKAHIKGELQKRNNAQAAAIAQEEPVKAEIPAAAVPTVEETGAAQEAEEDTGENDHQNGEEADDDEPDSVEFITERPNDVQQNDGGADVAEEPEDVKDEQMEDEQNQANHFQAHPHMNGFDTNQDNFNPMNFGMNGFNPMMAMQAGMGMPPFGMMPGMMGMPNMGMDPSMMFNGAFAGMNGMANMMNGIGANFGMGDMNDFTSYNHQYGNRYDDRFHGQPSFHSNRGYDRGRYGPNNYRGGRGQAFYGRGGRSRGGWNHQNNYNPQQQAYPNGRDRHDYNDVNAGRAETDAADQKHEESVEQADEPPQEAVRTDTPEETVPQSGEYVEDEVDYGDEAQEHESEPQQTTDKTARDDRQSYPRESQPLAAPPMNAPKGPKAMLAGLPNSGRYSRPQVSQSAPEAGSQRAVPAKAGNSRPTSSASYKDFKQQQQQQRRGEKYDQEEEYDRRSRKHGDHDEDRHRKNGRSRSRSPSRYDYKRKKHSSRRAEEGEGYHEEDRRSREHSMDSDRRRRREKRRTRDHDDDKEEEKEYHDKKRSRSVTPDESSARRRPSHRDDKEKSRRDRSREKRKSRAASITEDDDDHHRYKSKSSRSSRRERKEHEEHDGASTRHSERKHSRPAILEQHSDDIGFRIKGSKSRESKAPMAPPTGPAALRDPYAEERERMKEQRLQRDAQRRQSTHTSGKRERDLDGDGDELHGKKKRSRPRAKYEGEIEMDHEHERESRRWK